MTRATLINIRELADIISGVEDQCVDIHFTTLVDNIADLMNESDRKEFYSELGLISPENYDEHSIS
jgi:hypothetical protein